jgi:23S rRNA maturation-related 3'-5' exoribonuclease YhaM
MSEIYFEKELTYIEDEEVREQCIEVLKHVNENFYKAGASSTGKYHPDYAAGEGGLYRHTVAAVKIAKSLFQIYGFDTRDESYIIAAIILHDSCKHGKNWESKYSKHEHPNLARELVEEYATDDAFKFIVGGMVARHMGQWTTCKWSTVKLEEPENDMDLFIHLCDYLASRKFIDIKFEEEE